MLLQRAYSVLQIKAVDEAERIIEGIASTPAPDRMGDIVEPMGAEFELPIPFLWQHESRESAIGHVIEAKVTKDGIWVKIKVAADDVPGLLKDRLDYAWRSIKKGLVAGLSIGFKPLEVAEIANSWAERFIRWDWMELSAVTIPANADATMQNIKSLDIHKSAAPGAHRTKAPGASGPVRITSPNSRDKTMSKIAELNIAEQVKSLEATRQAKAARRLEIQKEASDNGTTKDAAQQEEFDTLTEEIKSLDRELVDLRALEKEAIAEAKAVPATPTEKSTDVASLSRDPHVIKHREESLDKGIELARFAMCLAAAKGDMPMALSLAKTHYPKQVRGISVLESAIKSGEKVDKHITRLKAAVAGGTTTGETWAAPLLAHNDFAGDFVEFLRPQTILGQFGVGGVPSLRRIPFNVHIKAQTSGGTGHWVGEGKPKPVTKFDFLDAYHGYFKVAGISVISEELIRFSDPDAERLVRDGLASALIARLDEDFLDPALNVVSGVSPASVTYGVIPIASAGTDGDAVRTDLAALWAPALAANLPLTSAVYIMTPTIALNLSLMTNALGQREFPEMTMSGGRLLGVPVIVSNYAQAETVVLAFASEIYLSDDDSVTVDASNQASIQMLDGSSAGAGVPTNDIITPTPTSLVSMYQTDSVALRAHRYVNWSKRRASAVSVLGNVAWGSADAS